MLTKLDIPRFLKSVNWKTRLSRSTGSSFIAQLGDLTLERWRFSPKKRDKPENLKLSPSSRFVSMGGIEAAAPAKIKK
jgi:hypothetical protein